MVLFEPADSFHERRNKKCKFRHTAEMGVAKLGDNKRVSGAQVEFHP